MTQKLIYESPLDRTSAEILEILARPETTPRQRTNAILSAIFHLQNSDLAGDILISEFSTATHDEKCHLKILFGTFYRSRETLYRIDESIGMLETYKSKAPEHAIETQEDIEELLEHKTMFAGR